MKKIFSVIMLLTLIIFATPTQAQADFNFDEKLIPCTTGTIWQGRVVSDVDFLALRSGPSARYPCLQKFRRARTLKLFMAVCLLMNNLRGKT